MYYNNYFDKKDYFYVPTFVNLKFLETLKIIKKIDTNKFILKYDIISLKDFLFSINYVFRLRKLLLNKVYFNGMDLKDFVNEEFLNFKNINASIIGIQNYLFAKNLKIRK